MPEEPTISEVVASGVDLLTCSGDKLLGGPQAGLIFGRKDLIEKLRSHPLARALRIDKLSLAALEATLRLYLTGNESRIPLMAFFTISQKELCERTCILKDQLEALGLKVDICDDFAKVGGGAMPDAMLPGPVLRVVPQQQSLDRLASGLRCAKPALVARIHDDRLLLDLRTVDPNDDQTVVAIFKSLLLSDFAGCERA
jgi:L-seryl-tRNA(Ser) seleniumtransferase